MKPRAEHEVGIAGRIAAAFLESKLTPLLVVASLLLGGFAVMVTPREEEPQIDVPMIDVFAGLPGATAQEVERRVISPLEKALFEIENVEYVYSTTRPSGGMIIVRFDVGSDPDEAVLRVQAKVAEVVPTLPGDAPPPVIAPRGIDDVPVVAYTLWSPVSEGDAEGSQVGPLELRRVAAELATELARHPRVAAIGRSRSLDAWRLSPPRPLWRPRTRPARYSRSRNSSVKRPRQQRNISSTSWLCQGNSPSILTSFSSWPFSSATPN